VLKSHTAKIRGGEKRQLYAVLTSTVDVGVWSSSRPGCITQTMAPGTHWISYCVGPTADLEVVERKQILPLPVARHYTDSTTL
jgi:hypothetical protein